ncbi:ATPase [Longispora fulva]|uniref:histidine kinase n=1 Tax=Longispora fulva TaxID=619741 RepID=A0A8J7GGM4_9ACTN|nr:sensor histidine kinase [Longispora fulva]MBG6138624.1 signal transduction histidine kinase [Longispora fulva]GIG62269.1 ATPase [Longispora fulva]
MWPILPRARQLVAANPLAVDVVYTGLVTAVSLPLSHEHVPGSWGDTDGLGDVLVIAMNLPLVARRRAPGTVVAACLGLWTVYITLNYWPVVGTYPALFALYTLAALRPPRTAAPWMAAATAIWIYAGLHTPESSMVAVVAQGVIVPALVWRFGHTARQTTLRNHQLADLAERLRLEQEDRASRAVVDERVRIARELHDVVAHHISVISVHSGLARYVFDSDPDTARRALGTIRDTSAEVLDEMRRLLALLRIGPDARPYDPAPGVARLDELARRLTEAGLPVEVVVTGEPRALAPGVDQCVYRIVQESLTNALRHAMPTTATVALTYEPELLAVAVTDDGPAGSTPDAARPGPGSPAPAATGSNAASPGATRPGAARSGVAAAPGVGHGLVGMRERAVLYGGTLTAGPREEGGFAVTLALPLPRLG